MQLHQNEILGDYLSFLRAYPNEVHLLADEFLITVTQFFRDSDTFAYLQRELLPKLFVQKTAADRIRVWSVGCATGEEAYSMAILLLELAAGNADAPRIEIFASDLHERSLERARAGLYPDTIEAVVSPERLQNFFTKEDSSYRVSKEVREVVVFAAHNLLRDPPFSRIDIIVCRNVLIYLQRSVQSEVIDLFHYALNPDGVLMLGPSETVERSMLFQPEDKSHRIFRRRNVPPPEPRMPVFPQLSSRVPQIAGFPARSEPGTSYGALHQKMVERYSLPSILVDQDSRIVHASESAGRYLRISGGEPSPNVFKLVREELRIELRAALHAAIEHGEDVRTPPMPLEIEGKPVHVAIFVRAARGQDVDGFTLVIFDEFAAPEARPPRDSTTAQDRAELDQTKDRLRSVIEQYETSQEEMKVANEELQSVNEELRSTMEELETSKEELQSMNEELQTVNQENRHKVEELSQLSSDLHNLIVSTEIATLFLDRQLRILRVTPQAKKLFNVRATDRGRPLTDLHHRLHYSQFKQDAETVLEQLTPVEREVRSDSGEWYLTRVLPYRSAADQIQGVVITLVEITKLKRTELALRDSEESFRALVTASAQIVWSTDAQGLVVEDSPSWRAYTGQNYGQWQGTGWLDAVHPEDRDHVRAQWLEDVKNASSFRAEFRVQHISGEWRWVSARAVPLRDSREQIRGWIGMNSDITTRKAAELKLRQMDQRKDEFLALLGHELRNPLAPLRTAVELFKQLLPQEPKLQQIREMCERQVSHLTRLVDDLLDVSRIKSGRIELKFERLDLRDIARNAISEVEAVIGRQHHHLSVDHPEDALVVEADETRLTQIITNLLDNAAKYTPAGGHIGLTTFRDGPDAVLVVTDDGIGIASEARAHVFEIFSRGDPDPTVPVGGLGLGLTLVQRLTASHGGSVEMASDGAGCGSKFTVRLPLAETAAAARGHEHRHKAQAWSMAAQRRILVVDDNHDAADSLSLALGLAGHEVRSAYDGRSALALSEDFHPDVIVLDIGLPDMSGHALAQSLRRQTASADAILVALTGYGQGADHDRSKQAGIDHHLVKPVDLAALQAIIDTAPAGPPN